MEKIKVKFNHFKKFWPLLALLGLGAFLRLYRIDEYMIFLGDEGRDSLIVRRLLVEGDPILIGPGTSVGNMYLGPLYYYLIAPFLFLFNYSPVGPSVMVAIFGVLTILFIFLMAKDLFGKKAAFFASIFYTISPTAIIFSQSSWNPNIMPFFALLSSYSLWKVWKERNALWLLILGISFAFVLQSHYFGLMMTPFIFIYWFLSLRNLRLSKDSKQKVRDFSQKSLLGFLFFALLMSPLFIFDLRHNLMNFRALKKFIFERGESAVSFNLFMPIERFLPIINQFNTRLIAGRDLVAGKLTTLLFGFSLVYFFTQRNKFGWEKSASFVFLLIWIFFGLIGLGLFKGEIYDHYFGFLFPAVFLLAGGIFQFFYEKKIKYLKTFLIVFASGLIIINLANNPFRYPPNRQLQRSREVSQKIFEEAMGKKFNLAVLAVRNYEDGYRYFLEVWGAEVYHADIWDKERTVSDQLFVVCERPREECDPTHDPKAEVANFGPTKIDKEWEVSGVILYKLSHNLL